MGARLAETRRLFVMVGLPYSGKSSWCLQSGMPIVSSDAIRLALHGQRYIEAFEPLVARFKSAMIEAAFYAGHSGVVVDDCHVTRRRREEVAQGLPFDLDVFLKYVRTNPKTCIQRAEAAGDAEIIPVIKRMAEEADFSFEAPGDLALDHSFVGLKAGNYFESRFLEKE